MKKENYEILLVEDDLQFVNIMQLYLQQSEFKVQVARDGREALELLRLSVPDLIISDIMMPNMDGYAFRHQMLQDTALRLVPFIFLTAKGETEDVVSGLKLSVDDYIKKPFEAPELIARIHSILERHRLYSDLIKYDSLTHLYNRRTAESMLNNEIKRMIRYKHKLSLLLVDIDNFKACNDNHGHAFGDYVILMVAEKLRSELRDVDFAGRLGGDEFIIVMPETGKKSCELVANRLRRTVNQLKFDKKDFRISLSGGIATGPDDGKNRAALLERADQMMYEAKRQGRNRIIACEEPVAT